MSRQVHVTFLYYVLSRSYPDMYWFGLMFFSLTKTLRHQHRVETQTLSITNSGRPLVSEGNMRQTGRVLPLTTFLPPVVLGGPGSRLVMFT